MSNRTKFEARNVAGSATNKQSKNCMKLYCFLKSVCLFNLLRHKENQSIKSFLFHQTILCTFKVLNVKGIYCIDFDMNIKSVRTGQQQICDSFEFLQTMDCKSLKQTLFSQSIWIKG